MSEGKFYDALAERVIESLLASERLQKRLFEVVRSHRVAPTTFEDTYIEWLRFVANSRGVRGFTSEIRKEFPEKGPVVLTLSLRAYQLDKFMLVWHVAAKFAEPSSEVLPKTLNYQGTQLVRVLSDFLEYTRKEEDEQVAIGNKVGMEFRTLRAAVRPLLACLEKDFELMRTVSLY